jgi:hypothetical protein
VRALSRALSKAVDTITNQVAAQLTTTGEGPESVTIVQAATNE